ncbi:hypothetical protein DFH06DRAFT_1133239 [Mycena polygramma]|nr:hypothetical protein DFH06DRAFT_1133239 [Mycena polygramma]
MKTTTRLAFVLGIATSFFVAEIAIGFRTKSLALIADAFHYLNDIVAYAIAFAAAYLQDKGHNTVGFTYAFHRAELVGNTAFHRLFNSEIDVSQGAFFNGVFLLALALSIFLQSLERFINIETVKDPEQVMIIGAVGLCLNILSVLVVHDHGGHSHSHGAPAAAAEVVVVDPVDLSAGVHAQHHHTLFPPTSTIQPNFGLFAVLIHLLGDAVNTIKTGRILLEAAPVELDLEKVQEDLLTSVILASLHVCVPPGTSLEQWERTEQSLQHCFAAYGVNYVTISPELHRDARRRRQHRQVQVRRAGMYFSQPAPRVLRRARPVSLSPGNPQQSPRYKHCARRRTLRGPPRMRAWCAIRGLGGEEGFSSM